MMMMQRSTEHKPGEASSNQYKYYAAQRNKICFR
jgi:hypothetical protein